MSPPVKFPDMTVSMFSAPRSGTSPKSDASSTRLCFTTKPLQELPDQTHGKFLEWDRSPMYVTSPFTLTGSVLMRRSRKQIRMSKSEIRNKSEIQNPKARNRTNETRRNCWVSRMEAFWILVLVISNVFRVSCFVFQTSAHGVQM